jgi:hypothetical protein
MDVLPVVSVCLIVVLDWKHISSLGWTLHERAPQSCAELAWLLPTYVLLAGGPVVGEFIRTRHR